MSNHASAFDVNLLAEKTADLLAVRPGQYVWIWANLVSLDFVEALAFRLRARGAFWSLRLSSLPLLHRLGTDAPAEVLGRVAEAELRSVGDYDAIVEVRDHGTFLPEIPQEQRRALGMEWVMLIDAAAKRGLRRVMVVYPTQALACECGLTLAGLQRRVRQALEVDLAVIDRRQADLARRLKTARSVHLTCPAGTDLSLRVDGRKARVDTDSLPYGETYVAPREDSAEGTAVIVKAFVRGRCLHNLRLTFSAGRVVEAAAADSSEADIFWELLAASSGDKDRIAEFAVGCNPGVRDPVGFVSLDEKIGGSVHLAIGKNADFGGRNVSNLHLDLVILHPTVHFDETLVLERGEFRV